MRTTLIAFSCLMFLVSGAGAQESMPAAPAADTAAVPVPAPASPPASKSAAPAPPLPRQEVELGLQLSHIVYKEPDVMRESGYMFGIAASYARNTSNVRLKFDGTLTFGSVEYVGSYDDGTPVTYSGIQDTMFEVRATLGPTAFASASSAFLPYIGLGYRFLADNADAMPGGYRRESNYRYIPVGFEYRPAAAGSWQMGLTLEYDYFLSGTQMSYLSDVNRGYSDLKNEQQSGMGYRASIRFVRSGRNGLIIEPFYRYWKIDQSETQNIYYLGSYAGYGWEPRNNSTEYGLRVQMSF